MSTYETWAKENGVIFSMDPCPSKSKMKAMWVVASSRTKVIPAPLIPIHLGHTLTDDGKMSKDMNIKRMTYIVKCNDVREKYSFLHPRELQGVILTFCSAFYRSNLWQLGSDEVQKIYNLWNSTVRDVYDVPRMTRSYIVENLLSVHKGYKVDLMTRYQKFYMNLLKSLSHLVRVLLSILRTDIRSVSGRNQSMITKEAGVDPLAILRRTLLSKLDKRKAVPLEDEWLLEVINNLLVELAMMDAECLGGEARDQLKDTIDVLCVS